MFAITIFGRKFVYDYAIFLIIGSQRNTLSLAKSKVSAYQLLTIIKPDRFFFFPNLICLHMPPNPFASIWTGRP